MIFILVSKFVQFSGFKLRMFIFWFWYFTQSFRSV